MIKRKRGHPPYPTKYTDAFLKEKTKALLEYIERASIPFIKEFAYENDIPSEEMSRTCAKRSEEFALAMKKLKDKQEVQLVKATLAGKTNPAMAIFCLKNVAGWRDTPPDTGSEDLKEQDLEFVGMPKAKMSDRYQRFYN